MNAADRLAALLRAMPVDASMNPDAERLTRERAHELLDAALDLSEAVHKIDGTADQSAVFALDAAMTFAGGAGRVLAEAVVGWTASVRLPVAEWYRLASEYPVAWREAAAACLLGEAPLPRMVACQLHGALRALDGEGDVPAILQPPPLGRGKGKQPRRKLWAEQLLLTWIEAEIGRSGRPAGVVRKEAADACLRDIKSLDTMLSKWRERDTAEAVNTTLAAARTIWAGGDVPLPWPREVRALSIGWAGGLEAIASAFREASENRPRRESRDG